MDQSTQTIPEFVMTVGVPGSGKSTVSATYARRGYRVLSSDRIRAELKENLPPDAPRDHDSLTAPVFEVIRREVTLSLQAGSSAIVDATNLSRKRRMSTLAQIGRIPCRKVCVLMITPRECCLTRNAARAGEACVPDWVMRKMFSTFECPSYAEGWDVILPVVTSEAYRFPFEETEHFSQDSPHHTHTLHEHLAAARQYATDNDYPAYLRELAYYHDIGKLYTKEHKNRRGEPTQTAHFYAHENYGAYLYLTEKCCGQNLSDEAFRAILYRTCLINAHMRPLNAWRESPKAKARDLALFGDAFIRDIELIHRADLAAH